MRRRGPARAGEGEDRATLIDLVLAGRDALVIGRGDEPEFKTIKLLDAKARVTVLGGSFTEGLRRLASRNPRRVRLVLGEPTVALVIKMVEEKAPLAVFISTGDGSLDERLSDALKAVKSRVPLVCVVDEPRLNDFNMPAIAKVGDIRVGVSTGGRSPAMAGILRRRLEEAITPEDVLQVRLQGFIRKASKRRLKDPASRKVFAYKVIRDRRIGALLRKKDYARARRRAEEMLVEEATARGISDSLPTRVEATRRA
ncbi:MAG TPA: bifunctional precorrin-2 dehydrogenase/sirohydrochlorin ferrochelatase [Nitrososphaerales archaeon]|nr:bifunctional precorrin-2 dehydrogenase/sirohydrochlorin ferrochelatase [Nitrososphaerales archaeon]